MAADFPDCAFTGVDLTPIQPDCILPKNCTFINYNILGGISIFVDFRSSCQPQFI